VVASHVNGDLGAVYVLTDEGADWLSVVRRDEGGWAEIGGGDGGLVWLDTNEGTDDRGVLACVIQVDEPGDYLVRGGDSSATVTAAEPYVVAVLLGVMADDRPRVTRLGG
jgi:hypothetical protein